MPRVLTCALPEDALLRRYLDVGAFADCYFTEVPGIFSQAQFVEAFYTSALFKIERSLLSWFVSRPSSDEQAGQLARGQRNDFAAWSVEARDPRQLLMCDFLSRTRSWLMTETTNEGAGTRLYFGSAVVPARDAGAHARRMGWAFRGLLGFHKLYSRALLQVAVARMIGNARVA